LAMGQNPSSARRSTIDNPRLPHRPHAFVTTSSPSSTHWLQMRKGGRSNNDLINSGCIGGRFDSSVIGNNAEDEDNHHCVSSEPRAPVGRNNGGLRTGAGATSIQQVNESSDNSTNHATTLREALTRGDRLCRSVIISWDIYI